MTQSLKTTEEKVSNIENTVNRKILLEFNNFMIKSDRANRTRRNNLKYMLNYVEWLGKSKRTINDVKEEKDILDFLKTKMKTEDDDPDGRWITTYNDYLIRLKHFFRWFKNHKRKEDQQNWVTPKFIQIKKKRSKRLSPYTIDQIWEKDEIQAILKHEPDIRNRAIITLLWDFDARNHEVTTLEIRNIIFKEKYAEGQLSHKTKTGIRPILLTFSFPFVRDWLNDYHPDKTNPKAKLICSHKPTIKIVGKDQEIVRSYGKLDADSLWWIMRELKRRIRKKLDEGIITDEKEIELLERLWQKKSWNPYCIRHSAITDDNANLKGDIAAKVGWSPNTKQRNRYIKSKMGHDMKKNILERGGIFLDDNENIIPLSKICYRCTFVNGFDYQVCKKCGYPLSQDALNRIKEDDAKTTLWI
jgi:site-specific recombinase XerD